MRKGIKERKTKETEILIKLNLDGSGANAIDTGVGFFDHMLELFACHGGFDLEVACKGDVKVDAHHSVEDIGITLGKLFYELLGDKRGIARYAVSYVPMDEALARTVVDISGRPYLEYGGSLRGKIGDFDAELVEEFLRAFATYSLTTLHVDIIRGANLHHMAEAVFKSLARALSSAVKIVGDKIPSSKGSLE
ncbi:MAG: imidazoleglycerol-phosphate dehydratase HisB [Clostridiales bacterium]|jgi:imidazoleglycerol-phosphate dehydratase|nr:imidazoleglycerol-phosphate dehydratase HisB [Clostridiales bacterium]